MSDRSAMLVLQDVRTASALIDQYKAFDTFGFDLRLFRTKNEATHRVVWDCLERAAKATQDAGRSIAGYVAARVNSKDVDTAYGDADGYATGMFDASGAEAIALERHARRAAVAREASDALQATWPELDWGVDDGVVCAGFVEMYELLRDAARLFDGTYALNGSASGEGLGSLITMFLTTRSEEEGESRWTTIDAEIGADAPCALTVKPRPGDRRRQGYRSFEDRFVVEEAPVEVSRSLLDLDLRNAMIAHDVVELTDVDNQGGRMIRVTFEGWPRAIDEARDVLDGLARLAKRTTSIPTGNVQRRQVEDFLRRRAMNERRRKSEPLLLLLRLVVGFLGLLLLVGSLSRCL